MTAASRPKEKSSRVGAKLARRVSENVADACAQEVAEEDGEGKWKRGKGKGGGVALFVRPSAQPGGRARKLAQLLQRNRCWRCILA